jgi:hypothetical protein
MFLLVKLNFRRPILSNVVFACQDFSVRSTRSSFRLEFPNRSLADTGSKFASDIGKLEKFVARKIN